MNTLPPDLVNMNLSFNEPKEIAPYVRFMYEQEFKNAETIDQFWKRKVKRMALEYWVEYQENLERDATRAAREADRIAAEALINL